MFSRFLQKAQVSFRRIPSQQPELARTLFKLSEVYERLNKHLESKKALTEAWNIRGLVLEGLDQRPAEELEESHFDDCIEHWSR